MRKLMLFVTSIMLARLVFVAPTPNHTDLDETAVNQLSTEPRAEIEETNETGIMDISYGFVEYGKLTDIHVM